jgi:hypothetical protein
MNKQPLTILGDGLFAEEIASNVADNPAFELAGFVERTPQTAEPQRRQRKLRPII